MPGNFKPLFLNPETCTCQSQCGPPAKKAGDPSYRAHTISYMLKKKERNKQTNKQTNVGTSII
jgi:hypothetical protein